MHEAAEYKAEQAPGRGARQSFPRCKTLRSCAICAAGMALGSGWSVIAIADEPANHGTASVSAPASFGTTSASAPALEVVVEGERFRAPAAPRDPSVAGTLIRRDRLVGPGQQAQDVLRSQPGVSVTESGGFGSPATAAIRGATAADTPVYLGGVRLNDDVAGTADLSLVPLWLIDHIEVYRGHAPIDADRLAPGGAIFFEPKRPKRSAGGVGYYGGSWGVSKGWAYAGTQLGKLNTLVGVSADRASNRYPFVNDHGTLFQLEDATPDRRRNSDQRTLEGWALARAELGRHITLDVLANGITRERGVPRLALVQTRAAREQSSRTLLSVGLRVPIDSAHRYSVYSRTSLLVGRVEYHDPLLELNLRTPQLEVIGRRLEQTLGSTLEVMKGLHLHPVLGSSHEWIERDPNSVPLGRAHREYFRAALGARQTVFDWLALNALLSAECHHTGAKSGVACDTAQPTGRVGFELGNESLRLLGNLGRYVRMPTLGESYGVSGTVHGNANLVPETSHSADAGVRAETGAGVLLHGAYLDAFVFARWAAGLIAYQRASEGFLVPYNVGQARLLGAEILTGVRVTPILRTEVSATLLDPRDVTPNRTIANDVLPYRSRLVVAPRIRADWKRTDHGMKELSGLGGELCALYQSSRYADPAGLGVISEQATINVEVYASWFNGILSTRARITDLFDAKRTDLIGYPLPGRSGYFGLEATW